MLATMRLLRGALTSLLVISACGGLNSRVPLTAGELGWRENNDKYICEGDCCLKGTWDETCVRAASVTVLKPDGSGTEDVRYIQKDRGVLWGLATNDAETVVEPLLGPVIAINSAALLGEDGVLHTSSGARKLGDGVSSVKLDSGLWVTAVKTGDGLAPVRPDGTLGPAIPHGTLGEFAFGPLAVINSKASTGAIASVLVDATGHVVWSGGEVRVYEVPAKSAGVSIGPWRNLALVRVGRSPLHLNGIDDNLYLPLDEGGMPAHLPSDLLGVAPVTVRPADTSIKEAPRPQEVTIWLFVFRRGDKLEYRVGGGQELTPLEILKDIANAAPLDDVRIVKDPNGEGLIKWGVVVGHRMKENDWAAFEGRYADSGFGEKWIDASTTLSGGVDVLARGPSAEDAANASALGREQLEAKFKAAGIAEQQRLAAEWQAEAARHPKPPPPSLERNVAWATNYFANNEFKCPDGDPFNYTCGLLEQAAVVLGESYLTKFYSRNQHGLGNSESDIMAECVALRASESGCKKYRDVVANWDAYYEKKEREQQEWQERVRASSGARLDAASPTVTVGTIEAGRLTYRTMTLERYGQLYGR